MQDVSHYLKAWEMSGHRHARSQRCLGYLYMGQEEVLPVTNSQLWSLMLACGAGCDMLDNVQSLIFLNRNLVIKFVHFKK